jgi:hypothetical protein
MNSLEFETQEARAQAITISEDALTVDLVDGRTIVVPLVWYPRLWHGTVEERNNFEIIGDGTLVSWPDLDEDLSITGILAGRRSGESLQSLKRWLTEREARNLGARSKRVGQEAASKERLATPSLSPAGVA